MINKSKFKETDLDNSNKRLNSAHQKGLISQNQKWVNPLFIAIILCYMKVKWVKLQKPAVKRKHSISLIIEVTNLKIKCSTSTKRI